MIRNVPLLGPTNPSIPRESGDDPPQPVTEDWLDKYSPRERG